MNDHQITSADNYCRKCKHRAAKHVESNDSQTTRYCYEPGCICKLSQVQLLWMALGLNVG